MVEKVILDYLDRALDVPVSMEHPMAEPQRYVLVEKTGSSEENHVEAATLAVQSYAESMYEAALLNNAVKYVMQNAIELPEISRCKCTADYNYTDITKKKYRYQAIFDIVYLGGN